MFCVTPWTSNKSKTGYLFAYVEAAGKVRYIALAENGSWVSVFNPTTKQKVLYKTGKTGAVQTTYLYSNYLFISSHNYSGSVNILTGYSVFWAGPTTFASIIPPTSVRYPNDMTVTSDRQNWIYPRPDGSGSYGWLYWLSHTGGHAFLKDKDFSGYILPAQLLSEVDIQCAPALTNSPYVLVALTYLNAQSTDTQMKLLSYNHVTDTIVTSSVVNVPAQVKYIASNGVLVPALQGGALRTRLVYFVDPSNGSIKYSSVSDNATWDFLGFDVRLYGEMLRSSSYAAGAIGVRIGNTWTLAKVNNGSIYITAVTPGYFTDQNYSVMQDSSPNYVYGFCGASCQVANGTRTTVGSVNPNYRSVQTTTLDSSYRSGFENKKWLISNYPSSAINPNNNLYHFITYNDETGEWEKYDQAASPMTW